MTRQQENFPDPRFISSQAPRATLISPIFDRRWSTPTNWDLRLMQWFRTKSRLFSRPCYPALLFTRYPMRCWDPWWLTIQSMRCRPKRSPNRSSGHHYHPIGVDVPTASACLLGSGPYNITPCSSVGAVYTETQPIKPVARLRVSAQDRHPIAPHKVSFQDRHLAKYYSTPRVSIYKIGTL